MEITRRDKRKENPEGFTIGLALVDLLPVIFFGISMVLIGRWLESITFIIGAVICVIAGLGKVTWKIILVAFRKNIRILGKQLRILMPTGFLFIVLGCILKAGKKDWGKIFGFVLESPLKITFIITIILMAIMFIMAIKGDGNDAKTNWFEEIINSIAQFSFLLGVAYFSFAGNYYPAELEATIAITESVSDITVEKGSNYIAFIPENPEAGFILYPGALVSYEAYAPLMKGCAQKGIIGVVVKMPDNLAFYDSDAASGIKDHFPEIDTWIVGGHSLGGAMLCNYLGEHYSEYDGLVLLGSYSVTDLSQSNLKVLCIYGSEDKVLSKEKYDESKAFYPPDYKEIVIDGGCHANFGNYGIQKGDGIPTIDADAQQKIVIDAVSQLIKP